MKTRYIILPLLCMGMTMAAQESHHHHGNHAHPNDSSDVFFRHLNLNELVVTGVTGDTKLKNSTAPISIISNKDLRQTTSTNILKATPDCWVSKQESTSIPSTASTSKTPSHLSMPGNCISLRTPSICP